MSYTKRNIEKINGTIEALQEHFKLQKMHILQIQGTKIIPTS